MTYSPKKHRPWTLEEDDRILQEINRLKEPAPSCDLVLARLLFDPTWDRHGDTTKRRIKKIMGEKAGQHASFHTPWTSVEDSRVMAAVTDQIGSRHRPQLSFKGQGFVNSGRSFGRLLTSGKMITYDDDKPYLSPNSPELDRIDWQDVASKVQSRSPCNCRNQFYNYLSIRTREPWSVDENERLIKGLAMHGPNSLSLSKLVGTRSPRQCLHKLWRENRKGLQGNKSIYVK